jgi:hypothetical protein
MFEYSSMTLSTCSCCVERLDEETLDVDVLSVILRANHEEGKLPHLRDDLPAFLSRDQGNNTRWDCLRYPVQFHVQSNNNTTRPRIIYNMTFP